MSRMVVTHAVVDIDRWLEGKAERVASFAKAEEDATASSNL
jgi:hypothetical protein